MEHAFYIWCAYGACAVILAWTSIAPIIRHRRVVREQQESTKAGS